MKNIVFISGYSQENIKIAEKLCNKSPNSIAAIWNNASMERTKEDFFCLLGANSNFFDRSFVIPESPQKEEFGNYLLDIILTNKYEPDAIIFKGISSDIWPIKFIKEKLSRNTKFILILEKIFNELEDFEKECLNSFDLIVSMGNFPQIDQYDNKIIRFFKNFEGFNYQEIPEEIICNIKTHNNNKIIFCSNKNYKQECLNHKNKNIINIDLCPDDNLSLFLNLADFVIDKTDSKEFDLLLKKMNKKVFCEKKQKYIEKNTEEYILELEKVIFECSITSNSRLGEEITI